MREFENEHIILKEINNIIHLCIKNETLDLEVAKSIIKYRIEFANNEYSLVFTDARKVRFLQKDARDYLSLDENKKKIIASAIYANTKLTIFLANFYINVNLGNFHYPTKSFSNKEKALTWLNSYR